MGAALPIPLLMTPVFISHRELKATEKTDFRPFGTHFLDPGDKYLRESKSGFGTAEIEINIKFR